MLNVWQNTFSDDYSLTIAIERTGRQIVFLPECLTPSYIQTDFPSLVEFTNRQIKITRIYRPKMWASAFATHFLFCFTLLLGLVVAFGLAFESRPSSQVITLFVLPLLFAACRGALRVIGVTEAMPSSRAEIMAQSWIYIAIALVVPFLYLLNFFASLFGRRITWRGIRYEIISPDQTRVLTP
jgi:ceramide glucosyltransferase